MQVLLLVFEGGGAAFEFALAVGEFLFAHGEGLLFGRGFRALLLFQGGSFVFDAHAFALDGVALTGEELVGELALEELFLFEGLAVLAFQLGKFLGNVSVGFVATGDDNYGKPGKQQQQRLFHGMDGFRRS